MGVEGEKPKAVTRFRDLSKHPGYIRSIEDSSQSIGNRDFNIPRFKRTPLEGKQLNKAGKEVVSEPKKKPVHKVKMNLGLLTSEEIQARAGIVLGVPLEIEQPDLMNKAGVILGTEDIKEPEEPVQNPTGSSMLSTSEHWDVAKRRK